MTWTIYAILLPAITASFVYISLSIPLRLTFLVFCNVESIEIFWRAYSLDGEKLLWWKTSPQMKTNRYVICHVHESSGFSFLTIQFPAECRTLTTLVSLYFFYQLSSNVRRILSILLTRHMHRLSNKIYVCTNMSQNNREKKLRVHVFCHHRHFMELAN